MFVINIRGNEMAHAATITSKGQITIPFFARKVLNSRTIEIEVQGDTVILRPVRSVAGALSAYTVDKVPFNKVRDEVWQEVVNEKNGNPA